MPYCLICLSQSHRSIPRRFFVSQASIFWLSYLPGFLFSFSGKYSPALLLAWIPLFLLRQVFSGFFTCLVASFVPQASIFRLSYLPGFLFSFSGKYSSALLLAWLLLLSLRQVFSGSLTCLDSSFPSQASILRLSYLLALHCCLLGNVDFLEATAGFVIFCLSGIGFPNSRLARCPGNSPSAGFASCLLRTLHLAFYGLCISPSRDFASRLLETLRRAFYGLCISSSMSFRIVSFGRSSILRVLQPGIPGSKPQTFA